MDMNKNSLVSINYSSPNNGRIKRLKKKKKTQQQQQKDGISPNYGRTSMHMINEINLFINKKGR